MNIITTENQQVPDTIAVNPSIANKQNLKYFRNPTVEAVAKFIISCNFDTIFIKKIEKICEQDPKIINKLMLDVCNNIYVWDLNRTGMFIILIRVLLIKDMRKNESFYPPKIAKSIMQGTNLENKFDESFRLYLIIGAFEIFFIGAICFVFTGLIPFFFLNYQAINLLIPAVIHVIFMLIWFHYLIKINPYQSSLFKNAMSLLKDEFELAILISDKDQYKDIINSKHDLSPSDKEKCIEKIINSKHDLSAKECLQIIIDFENNKKAQKSQIIPQIF